MASTTEVTGYDWRLCRTMDRAVGAHQVHCLSLWLTLTRYVAGLSISVFHW